MHNTWTFQVTGRERLHCAGCEERVQRALGLLEGIATVSASATTQRITVTGDPAQWDGAALRHQIQIIGYDVVPDPAGGDTLGDTP